MSELTELQEELAEWKAARRALATSGVTSYSIGGRSLTRINLAEINTMVRQLRMEISELSGGSQTGFVGITCAK